MDQAAAENIKVTVKGQDGREKYFRMKVNAPDSRLLHNYCKMVQVEYGAMDFLVNGNRFEKTKSPAELKWKNDVLVEAFMHHSGGGCKAVNPEEIHEDMVYAA